jgi:Cu2+-exporting ATPase
VLCDRVRAFLQHCPLVAGDLADAPWEPFNAADSFDLALLQQLTLPTLGLGLALLAGPFDWPLSPLILGGVTLAASLPLLERTRQDLAQGRFDEEVLESTWTVFYGFTGDFVAPNLDLVLAEVADGLQASTRPVQGPPPTSPWADLEWVRVLEDGQPAERLVTDLQPGNHLLLQARDICPADGVIVSGEAWLDLSTLTGEPAPLPRGVGKRILAGSTVMEGHLVVEVEALGDRTQYAQELELAEAAPLQQTDISDYAKRLGQSLILPTLALSGGVFLATQNLERALAPLQLDLITGIRLSTPTAILSMSKQAQRRQIAVRSGRVFETLTEADTVVFARTGTLTEDNLSVVRVEVTPAAGQTLGPADPAQTILALAAAAEQCDQDNWQHPVARAIVAQAKFLGLAIPQSQTCHPKQGLGLGVAAQIDGQPVVVGSRNYLQQAGISLPDDFGGPGGSQDGQHRGYWYVYVARGGQLLGQIICCARIRPAAAAVIAQLQQRGMTVYMVTGGGAEAAAAIGAQVGLTPDTIRAEITPQAKKEFVCQLQAEGHTVIYMGEGLDDYPALRYADVAVGTHQSCPQNQAIADLQLPYGDLTALVTAFDLADEAIAIVQQNIALITLPNLMATTLGVLLILDPVLVVIINNSVNVLAILNSLRPFWSGAQKRVEKGHWPMVSLP